MIICIASLNVTEPNQDKPKPFAYFFKLQNPVYPVKMSPTKMEVKPAIMV